MVTATGNVPASTRVPVASRASITGCVVNATPDTAPAGCVNTASCVTGSGATLTVTLMMSEAPPLPVTGTDAVKLPSGSAPVVGVSCTVDGVPAGPSTAASQPVAPGPYVIVPSAS